MKKILVIKLGALGDFVQAMGPFKALRNHYKKDHLTLLTTPAYKDLALKSGHFNEVIAFPRLKGYKVFKMIRRVSMLKAAGFSSIYDLQTSSHTSRYFYYLKLLGWQGKFSGIAKGCSHPHINMLRDAQHTLDRQKDQLKDADILTVPFPDLSFLLKEEITPEIKSLLDSKTPFVIFVPGGAPTRPQKRWPLDRWLELMKRLYEKGVSTVIIGGPGEKDLKDAFKNVSFPVIDLIGKTSFSDLAHLGQKALFGVGNDTGPMHLLAFTGCPSIVLFNLLESDPKLCGPRGENVCYLSEKDLNNLSIEHVWKSLSNYGI